MKRRRYVVKAGTSCVLIRDAGEGGSPASVEDFQVSRRNEFGDEEVVVDASGALPLQTPAGQRHGSGSPTVGGGRARSGWYGFARLAEDGMWQGPVLLARLADVVVEVVDDEQA